MIKLTFILFTVMSGALVACQASEREPAILGSNNTQDQGRQLLQSSMSKLLNNTEINLADNAFSTSSELILERSRNTSTERGLGRDYSRPNHFRLWIIDNNCLLEHVETATTEIVADLICVKAP